MQISSNTVVTQAIKLVKNRHWLVVRKHFHLRTGGRSHCRPPNTRSRIGSRVRKINCTCFRHISTSSFRDIGYFWHRGQQSKARLFGLPPAFCSALWASPFGLSSPKTLLQILARLFGPRLSTFKIPQPQLFCLFNVCLRVSDVLHSTSTTLSVVGYLREGKGRLISSANTN